MSTEAIPFEPYYDRDGITIYCEDCAKVLPWLEPVDLLLTDPPYGIGFAAQPTKWQREAGQKPERWDDETISDWLFTQAITKGKFAIVWGANHYQFAPSRCWLSWFKPDAPPSMGNVEYAWTNLDKCSKQIAQSISATNKERVGHKTQKPSKVMRWCISLAGEDVETILDPFAGSGTTLIAARREGRRCIGIEIEEKYCEAAVKRLNNEPVKMLFAD